MKLWKMTPLVLILFAISSCSPQPSDEAAATPSTEAADADSSATAPAPVSSDVRPAEASKAPASPSSTSKSTATPAPKSALNNVAPAPAPAPKPVMVTIPAGTELNIILADALNSGTNKAGDEFVANLAGPVYVDGNTILERGATVHGKVMEAEGSGRVSGKASMRLALTGIMHNDAVVPIVTKDLFVEAESSTGRDAKVIGGAAGIGAVIGAIAGGKKGAATGAAIGGGAGTGTVLATKGKEVDFPAESNITFTLDQDVTVKK